MDLMTYFTAERHGGALVAVLGLVALALAAWLLASSHPFKAMAWPLALIALIELGVGIGLVIKTPAQVTALEAAMVADESAAVEAEQARMERVLRSFRTLEIVEVAILAISLLLILLFLDSRPPWAAIGMGLLVQSACLLVFDLFAERRAQEYASWLRDLA